MGDDNKLPSLGYGFSPHQAGVQAAHDMADGKIDKDNLIRQYKDHKAGPEGAGEDFKTGYAHGASQVFAGH